MVAAFDLFSERSVLIGQFEIVAALAPYLTFPAEFWRGYPVMHYIDNAVALYSVIKGYSGAPDSARLVNTLTLACAAHGISPTVCGPIELAIDGRIRLPSSAVHWPMSTMNWPRVQRMARRQRSVDQSANWLPMGAQGSQRGGE